MTTEDVTKRPGTVHRVTARKQHDCAECADPILKGQGYIYLNTFDRGQWGRYVLCLECERVLNCHRVVELWLGSEWPHAMGRLREEVKGHIRRSGAYKRAFHEAWAASEPVKELA